MHDEQRTVIRPLTDADETQALQAHDVLAADDFSFLLDLVDGEPWSDYVERIAAISRGERLAPGRVPAVFAVADVAGRIAGRVSVRLELNEYLAEFGGHIGYAVMPEFRRRGIATALLRYGLDTLAGNGVDAALVTCDADNEASRAVIEACGGGADAERPRVGPADDEKLRFWIPTGAGEQRP